MAGPTAATTIPNTTKAAPVPAIVARAAPGGTYGKHDGQRFDHLDGSCKDNCEK